MLFTPMNSRRKKITFLCLLLFRLYLTEAATINYTAFASNYSSTRSVSMLEPYRAASKWQRREPPPLFVASSEIEQHPPIRILCYGDSLTAGTSPPSLKNYPYAPHLQEALNANAQSNLRFVVRHRGMPGWRASDMVDAADDSTFGLRSAIISISNPSLEMVIILAGTNDLGYASSSNQISQSIIALHNMALDCGVPKTVAIGIPPSGYQAMTPNVAKLVSDVNEQLKQYSLTSNGHTMFVPFPFEYQPRGGDLWAPDGLHFSPQGFQLLGESIAIPILQFVQKGSTV